MKNLFKNLIKTTFVVSFMFFGAVFADASGDFIGYDPMGSSYGITSISETTGNTGDFSRRSNNFNPDIPQSGNQDEFKVYVAYQNIAGSPNSIDYARARLSFQSDGTGNSTNIQGILSGQEGESELDTATLGNLPDSWEIELYRVLKVNDHDEGSWPGCTGNGAPYNYETDMVISQVTGSTGGVIDHLDWVGYSQTNRTTGNCDQGHIVALFRVTNTETTTVDLDVQTDNASSIGDTSARLNGHLNSGDNVEVWFVIDNENSSLSCTNSSQRENVSGSYDSGDSFNEYVSGLDSNTNYHYRACADDGSQTDYGTTVSFETTGQQVDDLDVQTDNASSIGDTSARLNGHLNSGDNVEAWFVMRENSSSLDCDSSSQRENVSGSYGSGDSFNEYVSGLNLDSHYYYKACADDGSQTDYDSDTISFYTPGGSGSDDLDVQTDEATSVGDTSARLNGHLNSGDNAEVWFVMKEGTDYLLDCANPEQRENVSGSYDGGQDFDEYVSSLNSDTRYYYKACANDGSQIDYTSTVIDFRTDDIGSNGSTPDVETGYVNDIDDDSADIHGSVDMNDYDNGFVFYVYGEDESAVDEVESSYDSYSDINEDGDNLQKVEVDDDLDGSDSYSETITGLDSDEDYYYNFCVGYLNGNDQDTLECGNVETFKTDDNGNNNTDSEIETRNVDNITKTSSEICGDLIDDGGDSSLKTWMEYRKSSVSSYTRTDEIDRGEGYYCETVRSLSSDTKYYYRACSEDGCDTSSSFRTDDGYSSGDDPIVTTNIAYSIRVNSAILPGTYVTNASKGTVWFEYGYSPNNLNKETRHYVKYGAGGSYVHYFSNLRSNQRYCYRAVIETVNGSDRGSVNCFYTKIGSPVIIEIPDDDEDVDLSELGLGLSLIRLEINDHKEQVTKDEHVTYEITWENISELDLEDLELNIEIPREIQITASSRGQLDEDRNAIMYTISRLDAEERNSMTVSGIVTNGKLGDALTADATIAFDNPVNEAREDATDYDVDEYVVLTAIGTASVFGLANITFLGWLTILLGLLIVFLVARWLYLEREELRAQAYAGGYGRAPYAMAPVDNRYDYLDAPRTAPMREAPRYVEPVAAPVAPQHDVVRQAPQARPAQNAPQAGERVDYRPYRPNRG